MHACMHASSFTFSFRISKDDAHVGVVVFSDRLPHTYISINLLDYFKYTDFKRAVDAIPYIGYRTRMDLALQLANEDVLSVQNGNY